MNQSSIDELTQQVQVRGFLSEKEIYFLNHMENPEKLHTHSRFKRVKAFYGKQYQYDKKGHDMIYDNTISIDRVATDMALRELVEEYVSQRYPGADSPEIYIELLVQIAKVFRVKNHDTAFQRMINNVATINLYEKHGHYFSRDDGTGLDITPFIEEHRQGIIGYRESTRKKGYRRYLVTFMDELAKIDKGEA